MSDFFEIMDQVKKKIEAAGDTEATRWVKSLQTFKCVCGRYTVFRSGCKDCREKESA